MTKEMRRDQTPQAYIRHLFAETENGKFTVSYDVDYVNEEKLTFEVNWTADDAEQLEQKYNLLTLALARIAKFHDQLEEDEENAKKLLSDADFEIWNTYVRPYEPFEVNWDELYPIPPCEPDELMSLVNDTFERAQLGDLIEEEELPLKQFCMWREEQSQKRIPFNRRSCADLITRAARYEKLISISAPRLVVTEEGRRLAEEMVIYYFGKEEPIIWD